MNVGLRIDFTVAEYFLAILAVQSPLRHSVTLWRGASLAVINNAKTQPIENVQKATIGSWLLGNLLLVKTVRAPKGRRAKHVDSRKNIGTERVREFRARTFAKLEAGNSLSLIMPRSPNWLCVVHQTMR
jgi:hypothetical protein